MIKRVFPLISLLLILRLATCQAQETDLSTGPTWSHNIQSWIYFTPDNITFSPIYATDKGWLHLEARYNYEELGTFSAWFGYNFEGGKRFLWTITPMTGILLGSLNGVAPGLETNFDFAGFNFNSTSQYFFDFSDKERDFYYNWTDFSFSPIDWLFFGGSFQRTRLFQGSFQLQRGGLLGLSYRWFELAGYWYNPGHQDSYFVIAMTVTIP